MLYHKQGDVYRLNVTVQDSANQPVDISTWQIASQIREGSLLIHELACNIADGPAGHYRIEESEPGASASWPAKTLHQDIVYTVNGEEFSTETFPIQILKRVTRGN